MSRTSPAQMRVLIEAARGQRRCETALYGGLVVNVFTGEIERLDVGLVGRRIALLGSENVEAERAIRAENLFLVPGFIDAHLHLESTLLSPGEFARAVVARGTTAVVADPHEIANVAGVEGIRALMRASERLPLRFYFTIPPAVPASEFDHSGARLDLPAIRKLLRSRRAVGIGEAMDYGGVLDARPDVLEKLAAAGRKTIDGHAPGLSRGDLQAYVTAGASSDHETTNAWEGAEKLRAGMYLMIRESSAAQGLDDLARLVQDHAADRCLLVTDDLLPTDIEEHGHLDHLLRRIVRLGVSPIQALRMVTLNAANRFRLDRVGAIAPGYQADIVGLEDLSECRAALVVVGGKLGAVDGELVRPIGPSRFNERLLRTVRLPPIELEDLRIEAAPGEARVIQALDGQITTRRLLARPFALASRVVTDTDRDILKIAVFERHGRSGSVRLGLINGFGLQAGAMASSVAHDAHNVVAVGTSDSDILLAVRRVGELDGGLVIAAGGHVLEELPLPLGGLMSLEDWRTVSRKLARLESAARRLGCRMAHPFMTLSFMCLSVVPELKITASGLVDVEEGRIVPLYTEERAEAELAAVG